MVHYSKQSPCPEAHVDSGATERLIHSARHVIDRMPDEEIALYLITERDCSAEQAYNIIAAAKLL